MRLAAAVVFIALARLAAAQQKEAAVVELAPIAVNGHFELSLARPESDPAVQAAERAIAAQEAKEEERKEAGLFAAKLWKYLPKVGSAEAGDFFAPSYSSAAYRKAESQLHASEAHALIAP